MNCAVNCTDPKDQRLVPACSIYNGSLRQAAGKDLCSNDDIRYGRWVKMYWGTEQECGEGYIPQVVPGKIEEYTCCSASQQCNAPAAMPPAIKCFNIESSFSAGYCQGKTASFSICAVSQTRANERAAKFAEVRLIHTTLLTIRLLHTVPDQMCRL
jgi:hypothetical protein